MTPPSDPDAPLAPPDSRDAPSAPDAQHDPATDDAASVVEAASVVDRDLVDPERPLQQDVRPLAEQRTLYLAASLIRRGFTPDLPRGDAGAAPQVRYLDRYVRLVRLLAHGERLFANILPRIRERLSFHPARYREERPFQARGPIDWPATLRAGWAGG